MDQYPEFPVLERFDQLLDDLKLRLVDGMPLKQQTDLLREYDRDSATLGLEKANSKYSRLEIFLAEMVVERFVEVIGPLTSLRGLKSKLNIVLKESIAQDFKPTQAKRIFYELETAASLVQAGFDIELKDPDIIVSGNGLSKASA